jgi:hypothetical protein
VSSRVKALVAGWFSFERMGATSGDLLVRDIVCQWLAGANCPFDVAVAKPFVGGVDWQSADVSEYSHLIFVCGPFGDGWPITDFLARFAACRLVGVNLSMVETLESWDPFDFLLERDSSSTSRPDLSFLSERPLVPVVGLVLVHDQKEYRGRALHHAANEAIHRLVASREISAIHIDTRLDVNASGLRTAAEVESCIARMDLVLTTRLHGLVLALKNGVPALAIDPISGGGKVRRQAETIGWPLVFASEKLDDAELARGFDYCLQAEAKARARRCCEEARGKLVDMRRALVAALER